MTDITFAALLKLRREQYGISQSKLAKRCDFDHSYVSRMEGGERIPSRNGAEKLATELRLGRVQFREFMAAAGYSWGAQDITEGAALSVQSLLEDESVPLGYRQLVRGIISLLVDREAVRP